DPRLLLKQSICEDCLMQRLRFKSQGKKLSYFCRKVVRIQNSQLAHLGETWVAQLTDISVSTHHHAEIPLKGTHSPNRIRAVLNQQESVSFTPRYRTRLEGRELFNKSHRAGARAAATMRRSERLVEVKLHDVYAGIAWPSLAKNGVHVGAVAVNKAALGMYNLGENWHCRFVHAERVRV